MPIKHIYSVPTAQAQRFRALEAADGGRTPYRKEIARVGRYYVPNAKMWTDITEQRLDHWAEQFGKFSAAGRKPYFTVDHKPGAEAKRGEVVNMVREGQSLFADIMPSSDQAEQLIRNNPDVSIEADPEFSDDQGRRYQDIITAVSAVTHPVITDMQPFRQLAASVEGGQTAQGVQLVYSGHIPDEQPGNDPTPANTEHSMFTAEQLKQIRTELGLGDQVKDADVSKAITQQVRLSLKLGDDVKDEQIAEAIGKQLNASKLQSELDEQKKLVASLQGQLDQAKKGQEPEVDPDVLEQTAELVQEKLSLLVQRGNIPQAVADEAGRLMLGDAQNRPKLMLSAKVAKAHGFPQALHRPLLELLGKLEMGVRSGGNGKTGPQHMGLPRNEPDRDPGKPDDWVNDEVKAANGSTN